MSASALAHAATDIIAGWPARSARRSFWEQQPPRDRAALERLLVQLRYLHERMVDGLSAALDRVRPDEARYSLSLVLVRHARTLLERDRAATEILPLPGVEALANQLFILATNDWSVFLALLDPLYRVVFPMDALRHVLADGAAGPVDPADLSFIGAATSLDELHTCLSSMEPASPAASDRARAQTFLLLEMADLVYEELVGQA